MKVYCVWAYDGYYPTGPDDLKGVFFTREQAEKYLAEIVAGDYTYDYMHVETEEVRGQPE